MGEPTNLIDFDLKRLKKLAKNKESHVSIEKTEQPLALHFAHYNNLKKSIKSILSQRVSYYDKE